MKKQKKRTDFKENFGKYLQDLSKLIFGAIFLGGILRTGLSHDILINSGLISALTVGFIGIGFSLKKKNDGGGIYDNI